MKKLLTFLTFIDIIRDYSFYKTWNEEILTYVVNTTEITVFLTVYDGFGGQSL